MKKGHKKIKGMSTSSFFIPRCDTECMGLHGDCTFSGKLLQQTKKNNILYIIHILNLHWNSYI